MSVVITTERLLIRHWHVNDAEALYGLVSDPLVMQFIDDGRPWTDPLRVTEWLERTTSAYDEKIYGRWAVEEKATRRVIGSCGFGPPEVPAQIELGYLFARDVWGRGYATEAAGACLQYGFERAGFAEVGAGVAPGHVASCRVLEKIGFEFIGITRCSGEQVDSLFYLARRPQRTD